MRGFSSQSTILALSLVLAGSPVWAQSEAQSPDRPSADAAAAAQSASSPRVEPKPTHELNFRVNPVGLLFGVWGADIELGLSRQITLGPSAGVLKGLRGATDSTYYQFGLVATYYLSNTRFTDSFLVRLSGYYIPITIARQSAGTVFSGTLPTKSFGLTGGYEWIFDNGLNVNLGAGAAYYVASPVLETRAADGSTQTITMPEVQGFQPVLEISVGWAI